VIIINYCKWINIVCVLWRGHDSAVSLLYKFQKLSSTVPNNKLVYNKIAIISSGKYLKALN
jgi:hypothetical protein